jgi:hypothetical protein
MSNKKGLVNPASHLSFRKLAIGFKPHEQRIRRSLLWEIFNPRSVDYERNYAG